ncbi:BUD13 homolog isoform X2 [Eurytemora carolleeae]|nr:BUD13 homolog isoform X2 [Eurytemora carolleeae]|eukprot:XP_023322812.1 BUD13 homolog isoform X2 [Eurytemora affinis]
MEKSVQQLEQGNFESDDSEIKQKYDGQMQINLQLIEQKKWLEHELEEIKQKIQNDKINPIPDMLLDWDKLSETELKRLVSQLEKTRNDLRSDIIDVEYRLDKEGKEFHHYEDFAQMYRAEVKSLVRTLDQLQRHGAQLGVPLPGLPGSGSNLKETPPAPFSGLSTESSTPGGWMSGSYPMSRKHSELINSPPPSRKLSTSPTFNRKNAPSPTRKTSNRSPSISPTRRVRSENGTSKSPSKRGAENGPTTKMDRKLGTQRKTAGVRNLPKIDRSRKQEKPNGRSNSKSPEKQVNGKAEKPPQPPSETNSKAEKSADSTAVELNTVKEEEDS